MDSKILLICSSLPGTPGVGGESLRSVCESVGVERVFAFVADSYGPNRGKSSLEGRFGYTLREACSWTIPASRWGRLGRLLSWIRLSISNRQKIRELVREVLLVVGIQQVTRLWVVVESPTTIALASKVAAQVKLPLHVMVWDDINHLLPHFRVNRFSAPGLQRAYDHLLRSADSVAVVGEVMKREFDERYDCDSVTVPAVSINDSTVVAAKVVERRRAAEFRIGFAGSVTARSAFSALLAALDVQGWKVGGRSVVLQLSGLRFTLDTPRPARIEHYGWRETRDECIELLALCDLLYLPQPFEPHLEAFSRLSFPAKFITYLAAGRPIFLHTPEYASLRKFNEAFPLGYWHGTVNPEALSQSLDQAFGSLGSDKALEKVRELALDQFSSRRQSAALREFLRVR
jgi:hypothetical protein